MRPVSEAELAEAIRDARGPLALRGGGTRGVCVAGEVLDLSGLSGITLYEPGALTMVTGAGTPLAEIEAALAAEGQRLAFEPMDHRGLLGTSGTPTIGGVVAANISGPRRIQVGACRDFLLGVRFVDGTGTAISNGGRVMKNVTGYDLAKLMCGSHGTLGALSEVSFKVLPDVEMAATLQIDGLTPEQAVRAMSAALCSPYEVSGAAHVTTGHPGAPPATTLRLEGFAESVAYRTSRLQALLGEFGEGHVQRDQKTTAQLWQDIRDVLPFQKTPGDVWRISVKPSDGPEVVDRLDDAPCLMDWAGGLIWTHVAAGADVRKQLDGIAGHATLVRSDPETQARLGRFEPEPSPLAAISAGLRAKFDPRGVLNPGLMSHRQGVPA